MRPEAPAWAARYIGVPVVEKGRTLAGADCLGLGRIIMRQRTGIEIPDVTDYPGTRKEDAPACMARHRQALAQGDWLPVEAGAEQPFDWLVVRVIGLPWHYAVVIVPSIAIHAMNVKQGSVLLRYREPQYRHVIAQPGAPKVEGSGFYRHREMAARAAA